MTALPALYPRHPAQCLAPGRCQINKLPAPGLRGYILSFDSQCPLSLDRKESLQILTELYFSVLILHYGGVWQHAVPHHSELTHGPPCGMGGDVQHAQPTLRVWKGRIWAIISLCFRKHTQAALQLMFTDWPSHRGGKQRRVQHGNHRSHIVDLKVAKILTTHVHTRVIMWSDGRGNEPYRGIHFTIYTCTASPCCASYTHTC